jgi:hypothetical protein
MPIGFLLFAPNVHLQVVVADCEECQCPAGQKRSRKEQTTVQTPQCNLQSLCASLFIQLFYLCHYQLNFVHSL